MTLPKTLAERVWLGLVATLAIMGFAHGVRGRCIDFAVYWRAVQRFWSASALYLPSDGKMQFKYAPPTAMLLSPWSWGSAELSAALWNVTSVGILAWVATVLLRELPPWAPARLRPWIPTLALLVLANPLFWELEYGQVDVAILGLLTGSMLASRANQPWRAGLLFSIAVLLKMPAGIFGIYFLHRQRYRAIATALVCLLALWVPVVLAYGMNGTLEQVHSWRETLLQSTLPWAKGRTSQGLTTLFVLGLTQGSKATGAHLLLAQGLAIASFVGVLAVLRPRSGHLFACLCLGAALLSPLAWTANFVLALPAVALLLAGDPRHPRATSLGVLNAAMLFCVGLLVNHWFWSRAATKMFLGAYRPFAWGFLALLLLTAWYGRGWASKDPVGLSF